MFNQKNHELLLSSLIFLWFISLGITFPLPLTPIIFVFFLIFTIIRYSRENFNYKERIKALKNRSFILLFTNYSIFIFSLLLYLYLTEYKINLAHFISPIFRGIIFISTISIILFFKIHLPRATLRKVIILASTAIAGLSLAILSYKYLYSYPNYSRGYTSSMVQDYNFFCLPLLLGLIAIFTQNREEFKKTHLLYSFLIIQTIYFSYSRRAFVLLNAILLISLIFNQALSKKVRATIALCLIFINPLINPEFLQSVYKTTYIELGGSPSIWRNFSGMYQFRYLRVFGVNKDIETIRFEKQRTKTFFELPEEKATIIDQLDRPERGNYDDGGRIERWKYAYLLFKNYSLSEKIFGKGFSYIDYFKEKFNSKASRDYPHLMGASVILYSGIIGWLVFATLLMTTTYQLIKSKDLFASSIFCTIILMISISMNTPFDSYVQLFAFAILIFIKKPETKKAPEGALV